MAVVVVDGVVIVVEVLLEVVIAALVRVLGGQSVLCLMFEEHLCGFR